MARSGLASLARRGLTRSGLTLRGRIGASIGLVVESRGVAHGLGGYVQFTVYTGGSVYASWNWPSAGSPTGSALAQNTKGIKVTYNLINVGSNSPTLVVIARNL